MVGAFTRKAANDVRAALKRGARRRSDGTVRRQLDAAIDHALSLAQNSVCEVTSFAGNAGRLHGADLRMCWLHMAEGRPERERYSLQCRTCCLLQLIAGIKKTEIWRTHAVS